MQKINMKEEYFSTDIIDSKALELLAKTQNIVRSANKQVFIPKKSALIVIDMQNYFCNENSHAFIPSSTAIIPNIKSLIDKYKSKNLPIIFTKHVNNEQNAGMMNKWWKDTIFSENNTSEIISGLNTQNAYLIEKTQYDSFYNTELESFLIKNKVHQLLITGVMTHLCCESTARSAFVRGFETFLAIDATATYNINFHLSSMINLSHGFSGMILSNEACSVFNKDNNDEKS